MPKSETVGRESVMDASKQAIWPLVQQAMYLARLSPTESDNGKALKWSRNRKSSGMNARQSSVLEGIEHVVKEGIWKKIIHTTS